MTARTENPWRVEIQERFYKKLARLSRPHRETVLTALSDLQENPFAFDLKPLRGRTKLALADWNLANSPKNRDAPESYCGIRYRSKG
jgi:hypothetical protein